MPEFTLLEKRLAYRFDDMALLRQSLCHSTYVNEHPDEPVADNQRLEFLGDAVLGLVVGHLLMTRYPDSDEGFLSRTRAGLVNERQLAEIAHQLDLGAFLLLGKGERQSQGARKKSILADAFEALLAAVYLDGGFESAFAVVERCFANLLSQAEIDHKTRLQEIIQQKSHETPFYETIKTFGPDHEKTFQVRLTVNDMTVDGFGKSKKQAAQDAARQALEHIHPTE